MENHREMAGSVVLDLHGRFLLQLRDNKPTTRNRDKLAFFGGLREGDESFLECAIREFQEELTYSIPADRFEHFMSYRGPDLEVEGCTAHGEIFIVRNIPADAVTVTEGSLFIAEARELHSLKDRFAPFSRFILETLMAQNPSRYSNKQQDSRG
jgi:8-oxo-dGTP diphosphatase